MSSVSPYLYTFEQQHALGLYGPAHSAPVGVRVTEKNEYSVYPIDAEMQKKETLSVEFKEALPRTIYDHLCQTKKGSKITAIYWPLRTHTWKELLLDLTIPLTRRLYANSEENRTWKDILLLIGSAVSDFFTFFVRMFTVYFAHRQNKKNSHPVETYLKNQDPPEALYVKCTKIWTLTAFNPEQKFTTSCTFFWRVDLVSPLSETSYYEEQKHPIVDSDDGSPFYLFNNSAWKAYFDQLTIHNEHISNFTHHATSEGLSQTLKGYVQRPQLVFID